MTKEEFIALYSEWRDPKLTRREFDALYVALPCSCGLWGCKGWQVKSTKSQSGASASAIS